LPIEVGWMQVHTVWQLQPALLLMIHSSRENKDLD
jgi:hypothetical protein